MCFFELISNALRDMNMTRKKASTTAYQAFTPENLLLTTAIGAAPDTIDVAYDVPNMYKYLVSRQKAKSKFRSPL